MAGKKAARGAARRLDPACGIELVPDVADPGRSNAELIELARHCLMRAVPESAIALGDGAKDGSVPHIKLLLQLVGLDGGGLAPVVVRPRERTLEEIDMEVWNREP